MTMLEDKVRGAIHAKAGEIPPGTLPPLRLPARRQPAWRGLSGRLSGWRGLSLAAPIAAAVAVAAVIAAVFAVGGAIHLGSPRPARPAGNPSAPPRYYVALTFTGKGIGKPVRLGTPSASSLLPADAVVRVTATGRAVAKIAPPRPYQAFDEVTAAAGDRTFVLDAARGGWGESKLFLLRLGPGGRPAPLIPLRVPPVVTNGVTGLALSPNGARLAVEAGAATPSLFVVNLATGAERSWVPAGIGTDNPLGTQDSLSWTADGRTLAFIFWGDPGGGGVRLLDVAAPGRNLLADSRLALGQPKNARRPGYWIQARVTPDGHTIVAVRGLRDGLSEQLAEFSARTGKLVRVLSDIRFLSGGETVGWASPSGSVLIVTNAKRGHRVSPFVIADASAGVLKDGHYTPLPWSSYTLAAAW
jgi:hypothetical protein